ncbi:MAG: hypothetical protein OXE99_10210 [Cellvibrionales bacterium]|nr:hypothetical protein [Cellvibrionales bacterium]
MIKYVILALYFSALLQKGWANYDHGKDLRDLRHIGQLDKSTVNRFLSALPESHSVVSGISLSNLPDKGQDRTMNHSNKVFDLYGVCDGHGTGGEIVASAITSKDSKASLFHFFDTHYKSLKEKGQDNEPLVSAQTVCLAVNDRLAQEPDIGDGGTTLSAGVDLANDDNAMFLNVGDSPIIIVTKEGEVLTNQLQDQFNEAEIARVKSAGVSCYSGIGYLYYPYRLQPSRDFGKTSRLHSAAKPFPYVYLYPKDQIAFTMILSDGLSDAWMMANRLNNQAGITANFVKDFIARSLRLKQTEKALSDTDMNRVANSYFESGHTDDMSVVVKRYAPTKLDNSKIKVLNPGEVPAPNNEINKKVIYGVVAGGVATLGLMGFLYYRYLKQKKQDVRAQVVTE